MKFSLLIVLGIVDAVGAGPTECYECMEADESRCSQRRDVDCATGRDSLGTTHCASAVGKYKDELGGNDTDIFFRGCFNCSSKKEACFALGGYLKADRRWTLLKCEIECCTGDKCNTQIPKLTNDAITVFTPSASGPTQCQACYGTAAFCSKNQERQVCATDRDSLGTTHCGSAILKMRDMYGRVLDGFIQGCINCADKKAACAAIGGYLRDELRVFVLQCEIECCTGDNCTPQISTRPPPTGNPLPKGPRECYYCLEADGAECRDRDRDCAPGNTHCASAVGKYKDERRGGNDTDVFFRGCLDCSSKKEACFALGGYLKADKGWALLECEIECCTGDKCNTQIPKLTKDAITVFTPSAPGPTQCQACFGGSAAFCLKNQYTQGCAADSNSLGTTHCGSAILKLRDVYGRVLDGFIRGCINCADKKAACAAIGGYLIEQIGEFVLQCEIECCTDDNCTPQVPTFPPTGNPLTSTARNSSSGTTARATTSTARNSSSGTTERATTSTARNSSSGTTAHATAASTAASGIAILAFAFTCGNIVYHM